MRHLFLIGVFTLALLVRFAGAQTSDSAHIVKEPLPPGPLIVAHMPSFAQWSIDYTYPPALKPAPSAAGADPSQQPAPDAPKTYRPVHVLVTQTGDITHEERVFEGDLKGEMWSNSEVAAEQLPYSSELVGGLSNGVTGNSFPEFDWISNANYLGTKTHNKTRCLVFQQDQYGIENTFLGTATAYIDIATRYPVEYERNSESHIYTILPPPQTQLIMPDNFLAAGKAVLDRLKKGTTHVGPP